MAQSLFATGHAVTNRVEAFSDGVLAIVITLLVLDVKVPTESAHGDAQLWAAIIERLPVIAAWIVSFAFVLVFWVAHHYLFSHLEKVDRGLLWLNGLFLLTVSFTPFPTALAGAYPASRPAVFMLSLAMFLTAASFSLMRWYALYPGKLFRPGLSDASHRTAMRKSLTAPLLYGAAMALSFLWTPAAIAIQVLVPVLFFLPGRTISSDAHIAGI